MRKILPQADNSITRYFSLGGMKEVGKNMYCIEHKDEILLIDVGVKFVDDNMLGVDLIIPDINYLQMKAKKGSNIYLIITHGHEDHIGALPYMFDKIKYKFAYAPAFSIKILDNKDKKIHRFINFKVARHKTKFRTKYFVGEYFQQTHSIPDAYGLMIYTPNGNIIHTGDFKMDLTSPSHTPSWDLLAKYAHDDVSLLVSDSTNSLVPGYSASENVVIKSFKKLFENADKKLFITTFASNVNRLNSILTLAKQYNRKVVLVGTSIKKMILAAKKINFIKVNDNLIIPENDVCNYPDEKIVVVCTGSQGEINAGLSKIVNNQNKNFSIKENDIVFFSSNPIPGNFLQYDLIIDNLLKTKAKILTSKNESGAHTSGHANQLEQQLFINLCKPSNFLAMHGIKIMLDAHCQSAIQCGIKKENTFVMKIGQQLGLKNKKCFVLKQTLPVGEIYISQKTNTHFPLKTIIERRNLKTYGLFICIVTCNVKKILRLKFGFKGINQQIQSFLNYTTKDLQANISPFNKENIPMQYKKIKGIVGDYLLNTLGHKCEISIIINYVN